MFITKLGYLYLWVCPTIKARNNNKKWHLKFCLCKSFFDRAASFGQLDILSTWHFFNSTFCTVEILSTWHFVNLTFCQLDILSTWHFVNWNFVNWNFVNLTFSQTCHFVNLTSEKNFCEMKRTILRLIG
jgi:hypothetical protein